MKTRKVLAEVFLTRKMYDVALVQLAGFMQNVWPILITNWDISGVTVSTTKRQNVQHISKLNTFKRDFLDGKFD